MFRCRVVGAATVLFPVILASCGEKPEEAAAPPAGPAAGLDRTVLPIAEPPVVSITEVDARKATAPPRASR